MEFKIEKDGLVGKITYNKKKKSYKISFPDAFLVKDIKAFLNKKQEFTVPASDKFDDHHEIEAFPVAQPHYFTWAVLRLNHEFNMTAVIAD